MGIRAAMRKVPRYRWLLIAALLAATLFFVVQMGFLPGGHGAAAPKGFELLDTLMGLIRDDYLEERDPVRTAEGAYRGMVNSLDPLSAYLPEDLVAAHLDPGSLPAEPGLAVLKRHAAFPQVVAVFPGSPAEAAAVKAGDLLSAVDGRNTLGMSLAEVKLRLRGRDQARVRLRLLREGETLELDVARAPLFPAPYTFTRTAGRPAVLAVHRFDASLAAGVRRDVIPSLAGRKASLVLDLRSCQDGEHASAAELVNLFVKAADAGRFEGRDGGRTPLACPDEPALGAIPLVVWVNPGTAGPAELAAGLLRETGRAKIVGFQTTGLVGRTSLFPLEDGSAVLLTSSVFALPSGRKLWGEGLVPDAPIPFDKLDDATYHQKTASLLPKR